MRARGTGDATNFYSLCQSKNSQNGKLDENTHITWVEREKDVPFVERVNVDVHITPTDRHRQT